MNAVLTSLRSHPRIGFTAGTVAAAALAVLVAVLVGGSLTQSPAALAVSIDGSRAIASVPIEAKLSGLQLPTLAFEEE